MELALQSVGVEAPALFDILRVVVVAVRQEAASKRIEAIQRETVMAEAGEELRFDSMVQRVV